MTEGSIFYKKNSVLRFSLLPPPTVSWYEDQERGQRPVAVTGHKRHSMFRSSGKFKGNSQCILSVPNTRSSEGTLQKSLIEWTFGASVSTVRPCLLTPSWKYSLFWGRSRRSPPKCLYLFHKTYDVISKKNGFLNGASNLAFFQNISCCESFVNSTHRTFAVPAICLCIAQNSVFMKLISVFVLLPVSLFWIS